MEQAQLGQPKPSTREVSAEQPAREEPSDKQLEEIRIAVRHEKLVFERVEKAAKWTALGLVIFAVATVLWMFRDALRALVSGK